MWLFGEIMSMSIPVFRLTAGNIVMVFTTRFSKRWVGENTMLTMLNGLLDSLFQQLLFVKWLRP